MLTKKAYQAFVILIFHNTKGLKFATQKRKPTLKSIALNYLMKEFYLPNRKYKDISATINTVLLKDCKID